MQNESCPLCETTSQIYQISKKYVFYECSICMGVFRGRKHRLSQENEFRRYQLHQNDVHDTGYQQYMMPVIQKIIQNHPMNSSCLDFGCGPSSVVFKLLTDHGFQPALYDPYFFPDNKMLHQKWDLIVCTEVIEHFYSPLNMFFQLYDLLKDKGVLYCTTRLLSPDVVFENWFYKNDATHTFFYRPETILFLKQKLGFKSIEMIEKLIVFYK